MEPLLYVGITHAVFVALFMLCKQPNTLSDKIIAVWMVFLACPMITRLCSMTYPNVVIPGLFSVRSFPLTFGPLLWMYTNVLIDKKRVITKRDLWHFLPFLIFALVQIVFPEQFVFPGSDAPPPSLLERMHRTTIMLSLLGYSGTVLVLLTHHYEAIYVPSGNLNWFQAAYLAQDAGGYLTSITSKEENTFVFDLVSDEKYFWRFPKYDGDPNRMNHYEITIGPF